VNETGSQYSRALLVGDNPFHNISHLSQDRTRERGDKQTNPEQAARLISIAVENGANGFLFSVSDTTLAILETLKKMGAIEGLDLYPIVPYAYEYVRLATQVGGIPGLAKVFSKRFASSGSFGAMASGLNGVLRSNPASLLKTYLTYEMNRIRAAAGKKGNVRSILLHEVIVDIALSLQLGWFLKEYSDFALRHDLVPGFNTCNFAFLTSRLKDWDINPSSVVVAAPFNKIGFQMNPSRAACEEALRTIHWPVLLAISVLAAGYLKPVEATEYLASLPNLKGVAVGVSRESQAKEMFRLLKQKLT
jgi:hypothetical protein